MFNKNKSNSNSNSKRRQENSDGKEWYLPDREGVAAKGPYETGTIVKMLKEGTLKFDDYICCTDDKREGWNRVYSYKEFEAEMASKPICPTEKHLSKGIYEKDEEGNRDAAGENNISLSPKTLQLLGNEEENASSPAITLHQMVIFKAEAIIHNSEYAIKAAVISLNKEKACLEMEMKSELQIKEPQVGDRVSLTIFSNGNVRAFTLHAAIIDKSNLSSQLDTESFLIKIELYFIRMNPETKKQIEKIVLKENAHVL
ncbi:MAG: hypothetical protein HQK50_06025 [Oligoflexia bacterium]|nr:hypothetical protein [Oligoflexia bacterium]MBF0365108.1 hypothetical protein [Oligoflexia bacterium]